MSALPERKHVQHLVDGLPYWPPSAIGWVRHEFPVQAPTPGPRAMQPSDFAGWTPEGRETLRRILEQVLRANGSSP